MHGRQGDGLQEEHWRSGACASSGKEWSVRRVRGSGGRGVQGAVQGMKRKADRMGARWAGGGQVVMNGMMVRARVEGWRALAAVQKRQGEKGMAVGVLRNRGWLSH